MSLLAIPLYKETRNVLPQGWGLFGHKDKTDIQQTQQQQKQSSYVTMLDAWGWNTTNKDDSSSF